MDAGLLKKLLGVVFIAVALYQFWSAAHKRFVTIKAPAADSVLEVEKESPVSAPPLVRALLTLKDPVVLVSLFMGCLSGFLQGAFSTGGPPIMILMTALGLTKTEIRATQNIIAPIRVPFTFASAIMFGIIQAELWPLYVTGPCASMFGLWLGNRAHDAVSTDSVLLLLRFFILTATVPLVGGDGSRFSWVIVAVYVAIGLVFLAVEVFLHRLQRRASHTGAQSVLEVSSY